jgi:hypothetical protein
MDNPNEPLTNEHRQRPRAKLVSKSIVSYMQRRTILFQRLVQWSFKFPNRTSVRKYLKLIIKIIYNHFNQKLISDHAKKQLLQNSTLCQVDVRKAQY